MSMNKKVISRITTMVITLGVIALLIAKLYDIGTHRPNLVYRELSRVSIDWVNKLNGLDRKNIIKASKIGPFNWDNKSDIGQKRTDGKWDRVENDSTVVYYRKLREDFDAKEQERALKAQETADDIIRDLQFYMGTYHGPKDMNGRKLPIYLPKDDKQYKELLSKMGISTPVKSTYSTSIIEIGPLGCQCKAIILHPDGFKKKNAEGEPEYIEALRREMAHYTYMTNLDFNQNTERYAWFVSGLVEYFAKDGQEITPLSPEKTKEIKQDFRLNDEFKTKDSQLPQDAGVSFIEYYKKTFGEAALSELIQMTYEMPVDSALKQMTVDLDSLKQQWIVSLNVNSNINSNINININTNINH